MWVCAAALARALCGRKDIGWRNYACVFAAAWCLSIEMLLSVGGLDLTLMQWRRKRA